MASESARSVFRSRSGWLLCAAAWVLIALAFAAQVVQDGVSATKHLPVYLLVAWVIWMLFGAPKVVIGSDEVVLHNVLRRVRIPWATVSEVQPQMTLTIYVGAKKYRAWAAPSGTNAGSLPILAADQRVRLANPMPGQDQGVIRALNADRLGAMSDSKVAALRIRKAWVDFKAAHPETTADAATVRTSVNVASLAVLAALVLPTVLIGISVGL